MPTLTIDGIPILLIRKRIHTMNLHATPTGVWVSAPMRTSQKEILRFLTEHLDWIHAKRTQCTASPIQVKTGDTVSLWGEPMTLVVQSDKSSAYVQDKTLFLGVPSYATPAQRTEILHLWYRKTLQQQLMSIQQHWEAVVCQHASEYRIRNMKTRWGTCNIQARRIWINLQLVTKPLSWLDYVMAHELTHLIVPNHSPDFWAHMNQFYPDWRTIRAQMRQDLG